MAHPEATQRVHGKTGTLEGAWADASGTVPDDRMAMRFRVSSHAQCTAWYPRSWASGRGCISSLATMSQPRAWTEIQTIASSNCLGLATGMPHQTLDHLYDLTQSYHPLA